MIELRHFLEAPIDVSWVEIVEALIKHSVYT